MDTKKGNALLSLTVIGAILLLFIVGFVIEKEKKEFLRKEIESVKSIL